MMRFLGLSIGVSFGLLPVYPIHAAAIVGIAAYYIWSK